MNDKKIDLHMHTINSDGTQTVEEILKELRGKGADIVAITDHDTVKGYFDILKNPSIVPEGLTVIPSIEITCNFENNPRDILGYGIDLNIMNNYFSKRTNEEYMLKKERTVLKEFSKKCKEYGFILDDNLKVAEGKKSAGFNAVYFNLIKHEENLIKCPDLQDISYFYWQYIANKNSPLFINESYDKPSFKEACDLIHKAGGYAFLAHPYCYKMSDEKTDILIQAALDGGIDGIECFHSTHNEYHRERIKTIAQKNNLFLSGGSDYHGTHKPKIQSLTGTNNNVNVKYEMVEPWLKNVRKITSK